MPNQLQHETSPYLLQHANNPVEWYPWGETALNKAKQEGKPILLSIGYSACHWCHVMAHESFEDAETAALMNKYFINIKVDREERPDLDKIYQLAHQLLTRRAGGWPLTVFLSPDDQTPFFCGTYFPHHTGLGMPNFKSVLQRIAAYYDSHPLEINQQNTQMRNALALIAKPEAYQGQAMNSEPIAQAITHLQQQFDRDNGGFGSAPKFPHPSNLALLLLINGRTDTIANITLEKMAQGGIYDQLGGGFFRYSVDAQWQIPHFEKMLYDNGPLLSLYAQFCQQQTDPFYQRMVNDTAAWVMREMQAPQGGYYASLDADSDGKEGKYYVWDKTTLQSLLTADEFAILTSFYNLSQPANFAEQWHLHITDLKHQPKQEKLDHIHKKLLNYRNQRVHPGRDDKIITGWNGLMIKGMATAGICLDQQTYVDSASRALAFIKQHLWKNNRLLATYKDGEANLPAYLDDYAFLIDAILTLLQARWQTAELEFAIMLADVMLDHFYDRAEGGFFFTADDHESLIQRPKPIIDEAVPAGNGIAANCLLQLGYLLGETRYLTAAAKTLQMAYGNIQAMPSIHCSLLIALHNYLNPANIIVIRGNEPELTPWQHACNTKNNPNSLCFTIPNTLTDLPKALADKKSDKETIAYVCQGERCLSSITSLTELQKIL